MKNSSILSWKSNGSLFQTVRIGSGEKLSFKKIFHDDIVVLAFSGATWQSIQNGKCYLETPDCVVLRNAGQVFSSELVKLDEVRGSECREIHLSAEWLNKLYETSDGQLPQLGFKWPVIHNPLLAQKLFTLHRLHETPGCPLQAESAMTEFVVDLACASSGQREYVLPEKSYAKRCKLVIDYLRENFDRNPSLTDLSTLVQMNPFVLLRQFKKEIGVTPHDYLRAYRVTRSKELIRSGMPLADVAASCGFADQSHFNRQFKDKLGISPTRYLCLR